MKYLFFATFMNIVLLASAQDSTDLFKMAMKESAKEDANRTVPTIATFKNSRLINGHSVETLGRGLMDFRVHHRFGFLNSGAYNFFGLDNATTFIGFDFGITDRLMVGISRSTYQKQMEGFAKYRLIRQSSGKVNTPVSVTLVSSMVIKTIKDADPTIHHSVSDNTSYATQVLIARKLNERTSIQLMPTWVHYNLVSFATDPNELFSLGIGARQKVSRRISINAEYYYQFNHLTGYYNSVALGVDIETGGHVFQLHFTNSTGMTEPTFIHETTGQIKDGDIHFGFNISRVFRIAKKKQIG